MEQVEDKTPLYAEVVGWYGMVAILAAFALNSFGVMESASFVYQIINATGALGLMVIAYHKRVKQSVILNAVWLGVAAITILSNI